MDYRILVRSALIAGLVAGLAAGLFGLLITVRYVDRAIALEEQRTATENGGVETHEEVFSRRTQKLGLIAGDLLYGVAIGCLFAGVFGLISSGRAPAGRRQQVMLLAAGAVVAVVLVPFLRYPPFPPGVGHPDTLARRQLLFISCVLLAIVAVWCAARLYQRLLSRGRMTAGVAGAAAGGILLVTLVVLLPGRTDAVAVPSRLLWQFRLASLAGQIIFWTVFTLLFARLIESRPVQAATRPLREIA